MKRIEIAEEHKVLYDKMKVEILDDLVDHDGFWQGIEVNDGHAAVLLISD